MAYGAVARRVQLQGQPGFSRSLFIPVSGEPVACRPVAAPPGGVNRAALPGLLARSEFDPGLGLHPVPERMLDLRHLGDEVGHVDQRLRRVAPGDDEMLPRSPCRSGR